MPLGCAGCRRGCIFSRRPYIHLLLGRALLCPYPARKRLPSDMSGRPAVFANADAPPTPESAADGVVISTFVSNDEQPIIGAAVAVKNAGGIRDWLRARLDDLLFAKHGIKATATPRPQY
jgi:hypothetical protein